MLPLPISAPAVASVSYLSIVSVAAGGQAHAADLLLVSRSHAGAEGIEGLARRIQQRCLITVNRIEALDHGEDVGCAVDVVLESVSHDCNVCRQDD